MNKEEHKAPEHKAAHGHKDVHEHKADEQTELHELDTAEREGKLLTGAQRGRLADLRQADTLAKVEAMLHSDKKDKK
jgi:hypothetical protein